MVNKYQYYKTTSLTKHTYVNANAKHNAFAAAKRCPKHNTNIAKMADSTQDDYHQQLPNSFATFVLYFILCLMAA